MTPEEFYKTQISIYTKALHRIKIRRNLVTAGKLTTFGMMVCLVCLLVNHSTLPLTEIGVILVVLFIILTIIDTKIVIRKQFTEELISCSRIETEYLEGNFRNLSTGAEFQDPTHAYSGDLDLFGEDSLFQHLNRTTNGTSRLASWLLTPSLDPDTIRHRQQTAKELSGLPEWCHQFRATASIHKTNRSTSIDIDKWHQSEHFFRKTKTAEILVYTANIITISSWIVALSGIIPYSLSLSFSLLQLLILALFLKKINKFHRQLENFIKSTGNYAHLVRLIDKQPFKSPGMSVIREKLFGNGCNALEAFSSLNRILNGLDQRSNVLISFVLNGLYLKDFHTVIQLDKWKERYAGKAALWIDAVNETDVFVSMANYRFNHPGYTEPAISNTVLFEAQNAGHPLMKGGTSITNDFKIQSLHNLYIVTGANMAGKSTFLRTVGVNLVLAHSGNVVCCGSLLFQPMNIFTSMRTTDNLAKGTSYFHAELLRLKQLVVTAAHCERLFIILDEMLKGTNSLDKLNGSTAFLKKLLSLPVSGLIATHDLALGELAEESPGHFFNVCFEIEHTENDIVYDYKLKPGLSKNMNASILLKQMGLV